MTEADYFEQNAPEIAATVWTSGKKEFNDKQTQLLVGISGLKFHGDSIRRFLPAVTMSSLGQELSNQDHLLIAASAVALQAEKTIMAVASNFNGELAVLGNKVEELGSEVKAAGQLAKQAVSALKNAKDSADSAKEAAESAEEAALRAEGSAKIAATEAKLTKDFVTILGTKVESLSSRVESGMCEFVYCVIVFVRRERPVEH